MELTQKYYTINQVQELVFGGALSKTSLHIMARKGQIPTVKFLNKRLVPVSWVRSQLQIAEEMAK